VPAAAYAVGLDFGHQHLRVAVCDLSGKLVIDEWSPAEVDHAPIESLDLADELVRTALNSAGVNHDHLLGIGMGIMLSGRPYHGSIGLAGEIGHALADPQWTDLPLRQSLLPRDDREPRRVRGAPSARHGQARITPALLELVAAGDRGARRAVADAGQAVGTVLAVLVNILNPQLLLVGGELAAAGDVLFEPIRAPIERHCVAPASASVRVAAGTLGARAEVLGAAALILAQSPLALTERVKR
jgi:predicted NBD/HSP70 family sugar kinase